MNYAEGLRKQFEEESVRLKEAREEFPKDHWIYLKVSKQVGLVEEVIESLDGLLIRTQGMGTVPLNEIRHATPEEIAQKLK